VLTPARSDARRNRTAILLAADAAFTQGEAPLPLPEIARRAGVGRATVYRHFSDRRALAMAVMRRQLAALTCLVEEHADDPAAFRLVLTTVLSAQAAMRPLVALLSELPPREQQRNATRLVGALRGSLARAQAAGHARPDLEPADLATVFAMLEAALAVVPDADPRDPERRDAAVQRAISVLVDGVCGR
jgi:AcrR family transcriptional regulator